MNVTLRVLHPRVRGLVLGKKLIKRQGKQRDWRYRTG